MHNSTKVKLSSGQKTKLQIKKKKLKEKIPQSIREEIEKNGFKIELAKKDSKQNRIKYKIVKALEVQDNENLKTLIEKVENLRNNLAHGNTSDKIANVKGDITKLLNECEKLQEQFKFNQGKHYDIH